MDAVALASEETMRVFGTSMICRSSPGAAMEASTRLPIWVIRVVFGLPPGRLLYPGGLNGSTQHFIPKRKDGLYGDVSRIFSELQTGARFIAVCLGLSERGGTPAQRAAKTSGSETPAGI